MPHLLHFGICPPLLSKIIHGKMKLYLLVLLLNFRQYWNGYIQSCKHLTQVQLQSLHFALKSQLCSSQFGKLWSILLCFKKSSLEIFNIWNHQYFSSQLQLIDSRSWLEWCWPLYHQPWPHWRCYQWFNPTDSTFWCSDPSCPITTSFPTST